jgi:hypothetical protein
MFPGMFGVPGQGTAVFTEPNEIYWGGDQTHIVVLQRGCIVSGAARDAGATPTTVLRTGLLMGKITASGKMAQWDPTATDGTAELEGVLPVELNVLDMSTGGNVDRYCSLTVNAPLKASALRILGASLVGSAYEYAARRALHAAGCVLDDDPQGVLVRGVMRTVTKAANYTVTAADTNTAFQAITGAVTFTLPTINDGLVYEFLQTTDNNMIINGGSSSIIAVNSAAGSSVTFNTSSQKLGARARFRAIRFNGALKWEYTLLSTGTAGTVA